MSKKRANTTPEEELKSYNRSESGSFVIAGGPDLPRRELKTESQSDTDEQEMFAGLSQPQTFPDYVDTSFNESQIRPLKEQEDLTFRKPKTIDFPINAVEFFTMCFADDADYSLAVFQN